ncbi:MAG: PaaI family thioesterase [Intestinibacter sp.]|uniref:PaaI family thioesterase n=1 Tax=Intestinibacter sp. TaxID=1965304 RepID=UPI0025BF2B0A|nr:PaaI family thioesterase [Intestinibacter sp.]MCI6737625.1 PaaI family thioesterase [Intestinibacter sp.]
MDYQKIIDFRNNSEGFTMVNGIKITKVSEGYAEGEIEITDNHLNMSKGIHGGCIFSLADSVAGSAVWSRGKKATTSNSNISFLRPTFGVKKLIAKAKEVKYGKNLLVYDVDVEDEKNRLIARATVTYFNLKEDLNL